MEFHEVAGIFPMMGGAEYDDLCRDIASNGLREAIWTHDGKIIDGRNRYNACLKVGVNPEYREYGGDNLLAFVISLNLKRRHLDTSQRAIIAAKLANWQLGENQYRNGSANLQTHPVSQSDAASQFNISPRIVASAKSVMDKAPELAKRIERGEMTVHDAEKEIKRQERAEQSKPEPVCGPASYVVQAGQVWTMGRHRLICGDAYSLIGTIQADALISDPPYGIDYQPDWNKWDGSPSDFKPVLGDDKEFDPAPFLNFNTVVLFGANYYSDRLPLGGWLCWDKRTKEELDDMFGSPFELAWYRSELTTKKATMIRLQHGGVVNADSEKGNNEKRYVATQKPVALMEKIIKTFTQDGAVVVDPFAGSGSTLLACERSGRTCYAMEKDPEVAAIILQRWADMTEGEPCQE